LAFLRVALPVCPLCSEDSIEPMRSVVVPIDGSSHIILHITQNAANRTDPTNGSTDNRVSDPPPQPRLPIGCQRIA